MRQYRLTIHSLFFTLFFAPIALFAQPTQSANIANTTQSLNMVEPTLLTPLNWAAVAEADSKGLGNVRFAAPLDVHFSPLENGIWQTLSNGEQLWTLRLQANDTQTLGLGIGFQHFVLPEGAKLLIYSDDKKQLLGAYTAENNAATQDFFVGIIAGKNLTIEYQTSTRPTEIPFEITRIYEVYKRAGLPTVAAADNFGNALSCEINVNCPQGAAWQNPKRGVVRIRMVLQEGLGWCSGSLVNNVRNDGTPYVLSAFHCQDGYTPIYSLWTFFFNYESANCSNPATEPNGMSLQGCSLRAGRQESDFLLMELSQRVPTSVNAYFNGWSRDTVNLATSTTMIHHPQGDIKKISFDRQAPIFFPADISWSNNVTTPPNHHWRLIFDEGTFEPGSSGSPIFDQQQRIIGQLHGGDNDPADPCINSYSFVGRFSRSWGDGNTPQTRLRDWLDPANTNALTQTGIVAPTSSGGVTISGWVRTVSGAAIPNAKVFMDNDSTLTNAQGAYSFSNITTNVTHRVRVEKNIAVTNGLDVADLLLVRRYILGLQPISNVYNLRAGDINRDAELNVGDLLVTRRVILESANSFGAVQSWQFLPSVVSLTTETALQPLPTVLDISFTGAVSNLNFIGFKTGDVNGSADGAQ